MNCKQGDLAIVVYSTAGNEGKLVRVLRFVGNVRGWVGDDRWEVENLPATGMSAIGGWEWSGTLRDCRLMPIRPPEEPVIIGQLEDLREPA